VPQEISVAVIGGLIPFSWRLSVLSHKNFILEIEIIKSRPGKFSPVFNALQLKRLR